MSQNVASWQGALVVAAQGVINQIVSFFPSLLGSILIFLIGWIIAGWVKSITVKLLETARINKVVKGTAVEKFFAKAEWKGKAEEVIGNTAKWIIILIFFIAAANILGLNTVTQVLNGILNYIPNVISAALILLVGVLLAGVVEGLVKGATGAVDVSTSRLLGKLSSWIVMIFSVLAAISELGIAQSFINTLMFGTVATLSIGFGLALGLGSKDLISTMLNKWYSGIQKDLSKK